MTYQLVSGGVMRQSFGVASVLLDQIAKINWAWYTKEDHMVSA